ncbi:MAG TPA: tape measure protein [Pyrinomonadaceae bacterium]|jgi:tape measure domain-containing protein
MAANYKIGVSIDARGAGKTTADVEKVDRALNRAGKSASAFLTSFGGNLAGNLVSSTIENAISGITSLAIEGGKAVFDYSARMEQTKIGFETLMGGAEAANKHLAELKKFAVETPFDFETLTAASRRLQNVGLEAGKIVPLMRDIGNAAAAAGASSEELDQITLAFSQIIAKGKVSAEEVNQLAERGVPVWEMLSKTLGKSKAEIIKLSEAGKISSEIFLKVFQNFSQAKFGDAMVRQSQTFLGAWSSIKDMAIQTAEELFKPIYDETSRFAAKFSNSLQAQLPEAKSAGEKFGFALGEAIGDGYRRSQTNWGEVAGQTALRAFRFSLAAGTSGIIPALGNEITGGFGNDFGKGFGEGFLKGAKVPAASIADLRKIDDSVGKISDKVLKMPDLAARLNADDAEKKAKALRDTITDLTGRLAFFGQESEVAAVKQKLINQGVYDFDSALAKNAVSLAAQLDRLKAAKKAQDEYNEKIKDWRSQLASFVDNAFEDMFPPQSELDRFNRWVTKTKADMGDLKKEVASTRDYLQGALRFRQLLESQERETNLRKSIVDLTKQIGDSSLQFTPLESALFDVAKAANLVETSFVALDKIGTTRTSFDITDRVLTGNVTEFLTKYKTAAEEYSAAAQKLNEQYSTGSYEVGKWQETIGEALSTLESKHAERMGSIIKSLKDYLATLQTVNKEGKIVPLFAAEYEIEAFISQIINLDAAVNKASLKKGLDELDEVFADLGLNIAGFGAKTELEKFDAWLSDANVTKAIEQRAKAIGMQADALKELLRQQKEAQLAGATRPRVVGKPPEDENPFATGIFGEIGVNKIQTEAEMIEDVYKRLGSTVGQTINDLAGAMGSLVENWVLYGNTSDMSARKAIASALAMAASQSAVSAIMETAYGIAALTPWGAAIYGPAPLHFKSAALFAAVAATTGLAGRAVAGDSFSRGSGGAGSSNAGQPDYQPVGSANVRESNRNFTGNSNNEYTAVFKGLRDEISAWREKIGSMKAGEVLTVAAKEKPGFIGQQTVNDFNSNGSLKTKALRSLGTT